MKLSCDIIEWVNKEIHDNMLYKETLQFKHIRNYESAKKKIQILGGIFAENKELGVAIIHKKVDNTVILINNRSEAFEVPVNAEDLFSGLKINGLDVSELNFSNTKIMTSCFADTTVQNIRFGNPDTSNVTDMSHMFAGSHKLRSIEAGALKTNKVKSMKYMFSMCKSLESIDVSNWDLSNVQTTEGMFYKCANASSIMLPRSDLQNLQDMQGMFYECTSINHISIFGDMPIIADMSRAFYGCSSLQYIGMPNVDLPVNTLVDCVTQNCKQLSKVNLRKAALRSNQLNSFTYGYYTSNADGELTTERPVNQTYVLYKNSKPLIEDSLITHVNCLLDDNTNEIVFRTVSNLKQFEAKAKVIGIEEASFGVNYINSLWVKTYEFFKFFRVKNGATNAVYVVSEQTPIVPTGERLFSNSNYKRLTSQVEKIQFINIDFSQMISASHMFYGLEAIREIEITNSNVANCKSLESAFKNCPKLQKVDLSNSDFRSCEKLNKAFEGDSKLTEVNLTNTKFNNVKTVSRLFNCCEQIKTVDLSTCTFKSLEDTSQMFDRCTSLASVKFPEMQGLNVKSTIAMFGQCYELQKLNLSWMNFSKIENSAYMFSKCHKLKEIKLGRDKTLSAKGVQYHNLFNECDSLDKTVINTIMASNSKD